MGTKSEDNRIKTAAYIKKRKKNFPDQHYCYAGTILNGVNNNIKIHCLVHGEFVQNAYAHSKGSRCPACVGLKRYTPDTFITKATQVHAGKYNYPLSSFVDFHGRSSTIKIYCPIHGPFAQNAGDHLNGSGCPECKKITLSEIKTKSREQFIKDAIGVHGLKYSYDNLVYQGMHSSVKIYCPTHNNFIQNASDHLNGAGCPECARINSMLSLDQFLERARLAHKNKYYYNLVDYKGTVIKVEILCSKHGSFWQKPNDHFNGSGCPICSRENARGGFDFKKKAIVYYFLDTWTGLYKIGITNKTVQQRFYGKMKRIHLIKTWDFELGVDAFNREQELHLIHKDKRTINESWSKGTGNGKTEFFTEDVLGLDKELKLKEIINENS